MAEAELPTVTQLASPSKRTHQRTKSVHGRPQDWGADGPSAKGAPRPDEDEGAFVPGTDAASLRVWQSIEAFGRDKESAYKITVEDGRVKVTRKLTLKLAKAKEEEASLGRPPAAPRERDAAGERKTTLRFTDAMQLVTQSKDTPPARGFRARKGSTWKIQAPVDADEVIAARRLQRVRTALFARGLLQELFSPLPLGAHDDGFSPAGEDS